MKQIKRLFFSTILFQLVNVTKAQADTSYQVQWGDTIYSLAKRYNVDMYYLARINNLYDINKIIAGQYLNIPASQTINNPPASGNYQWPVDHPQITSGYGPRAYDGTHPGADIISASGNLNVSAVYSGTVLSAAGYAWSGTNGGYGNLIIIAQDDGRYAFYGHLSHISVVAGQRVSAGQLIAIMGQTGNATGIHLHLEIRADLINAGSMYNSYNPFELLPT